MRLFTIDFSCAFLLSLIDLIFPMAVRDTINDFLPNNEMNVIYKMAFFLLGLIILRTIFNFIVDFWGHVLGTKLEFDMRKDLFNHVQKLSFTYFDNTKTGQIMSRLVNDLNEISELAHHGPEDLFIAVITLTGSFILMFSMSTHLTFVILFLIIFLLFFSINLNQNMRRVFTKTKVQLAEINSQVEDSISGVRVVKSFTNENYEQSKFNVQNTNFKKAKMDAYKAMATFFSGIGFFSNGINLVILAYGSYLVSKELMTYGDLTAFLLFVSMFLQPVRKIANLMEQYQRGMAGFTRFNEIISTKPIVEDKKNAKILSNLKGKISFENVSFSYSKKQTVLKNINIQIKENETVAIVGPSGAGKTTICSLIPRFYDILEGSIKIDNQDIRDITQKSLRENIGIVQQDVFLFNETVRDNILYGRTDATDEEVIDAAKKAHAYDFIMNFEEGFDTPIGERGVKLSGGQKQRLSIARIFLKNPKILILDEATSALDNETEKLIQKTLFDLSKNRTSLIIAHRLSTIKNSDRIIVLTEEGVVEEGTHDELLSQKGEYAKLYNLQFDGFMP